MKTIWKFPLHIVDTVEIQMPRGAEILSVATQFGTPCIWATVDPAAPVVTRRLYVRGTGHALRAADGAGVRFVGTFFMHNGGLVFHLFDAGEVVP